MKKIIHILLLFTITLTISHNAKSQTDAESRPPSWVGITIGSTMEGVSQVLISEYSEIVTKYGVVESQWWIKFKETISVEDRGRLEQIFKQMSIEQQAKQKIAFIKPTQPLKKVTPSDKEFNDWKNRKIYGVWINGKKVDNSVLNKYRSNDFEQVTVSRLYGAAKKQKIFSFQVNLMTSEYYQNYYKQTMSKQDNQMVFKL